MNADELRAMQLMLNEMIITSIKSLSTRVKHLENFVEQEVNDTSSGLGLNSGIDFDKRF